MTGQTYSIDQAAGGPALGWVGNAVSIRAVLLGTTLVLAPTIALYHRLIVRDRSTVEVVPSTAN